MIDLVQHIRTLLIDNDCVIIPGLGGFIAYQTPAIWMEKEKIFMPPTRMIGFNPQLKINDGLLAQSYQTIGGFNFQSASERLQNDVDKLISNLHAQGEVILEGIGRLRLDIHNTIKFIPSEAQMQTSALFGLPTLPLQKLNAHRPASEKQIPMHPHIPTESNQPRTFKMRINTTFLSNAVAVAAILILFFALSIPLENTEVIKGNYAQLLPTDIFGQMGQQSLAITPLAVQEARPVKNTPAPKAHEPEVQPIPAPQPTPKVTKPAQPAVRPQPTKTYHIIVASVGTSQDAKNMASNLLKKGYAHAKAIIGDGKMRVCIDSYATEAEAYRALGKLRQNETYKNAWILKKRL